MAKDKEYLDRLLCILGADFDWEEFCDFIDSSGYTDVPSKYGNYSVAETSDGMQIYMHIDNRKLKNATTRYKTDTRTKINLDHWEIVDESKLNGLAYVWNRNGDTDFPMNIEVVNAGDFVDYSERDFTTAITAFGDNDIKVFDDEEAYHKAETRLASQCCIPVGLFPAEDNADWKPSANILMSGVINKWELRQNAYTGNEYYHFLVECLGLVLDVVVSKSGIEREPKVGGIISGVFYLTAKLFKEDENE